MPYSRLYSSYSLVFLYLVFYCAGFSLCGFSKPATGRPLERTTAGMEQTAKSEPPASSASSVSSAVSTVASPSTVAATQPRPQSEAAGSMGVWWWDIGQIHGDTRGKYLRFLEENGVTEIYLCVDGMRPSGGTASYAEVRNFVRRAGALEIRAAALTGEASWIDPRNNDFQGLSTLFLTRAMPDFFIFSPPLSYIIPSAFSCIFNSALTIQAFSVKPSDMRCSLL